MNEDTKTVLMVILPALTTLILTVLLMRLIRRSKLKELEEKIQKGLERERQYKLLLQDGNWRYNGNFIKQDGEEIVGKYYGLEDAAKHAQTSYDITNYKIKGMSPKQIATYSDVQEESTVRIGMPDYL
jgi:hypothetical protein